MRCPVCCGTDLSSEYLCLTCGLSFSKEDYETKVREIAEEIIKADELCTEGFR